MFARLTRLSARRLYTTSATQNGQYSLRQVGLAVAGSATVASYVVWNLTSERKRLMLDSQVQVSPHETPVLRRTEESAPTPTSVPSISVPSAELDPAPLPEAQEASNTDAAHETPPEQETASESEGGSGGGAYDPVTGEINWDCPCLGGMAHGPCGPEFREAFSCFVHSEEEPKGINCVEKFQGMQNCFRAHPDVYGDDIMKDDEEEEQAVGNEQPAGLAASDIPHPAEVPEPAPSTPAQISSPPSTPSP